MAIIKKTVKDELKSKFNKLDLERMFEKNIDLLKQNAESLEGTSTAYPTEVYKFMENKYQENIVEAQSFIENKVNEIISDEVISLVNETLKAQQKKSKLEGELASMRNKIRAAYGSDDNSGIDGKINVMKLELEADRKEDEYKEARKTFLDLYNIALSKTVISKDLNEMFIVISEIRNDELQQIEDQIKLLQSKAKALRLLERLNILEDSKNMIDSRIKVPAIADEIIVSSKNQTPFIKKII